MENSHTVSTRSAVGIASKIVKRSKFGLVGEVSVWGEAIVARYRHGKTEVVMQVTFQPEITIEVTGSTQTSGKTLELMLQEAENVKKELSQTFTILKVAK
jgi:hypothetical protein